MSPWCMLTIEVVMVIASAHAFQRLTCDVQSSPPGTRGLAAAAVTCRAWRYFCLCLLFSSEPLFSNITSSLMPNARLSCLLLLFFLATHISVHPWSHTSVCLWTNSLSNLFSVMTLQLILQQLPGYLADICPLQLACPHPWANCILFNMKYGKPVLFLHMVLYTAQCALR